MSALYRYEHAGQYDFSSIFASDFESALRYFAGREINEAHREAVLDENNCSNFGALESDSMPPRHSQAVQRRDLFSVIQLNVINGIDLHRLCQRIDSALHSLGDLTI